MLFSVKDTGAGIKPEVMPKLFQKFVRAEDASKANLLGTGLGLYLAKQLIESQGGKTPVVEQSSLRGRARSFMLN